MKPRMLFIGILAMALMAPVGVEAQHLYAQDFLRLVIEREGCTTRWSPLLSLGWPVPV